MAYSVSWIRQQSVMNTSSSDRTPNIAVDSTGNCYVTYYTNGTVSGGTLLGGTDIVVFKMDTNGTIVWIKQQAVMSTTDNDSNPSIVVDSSGNTYVTYYTNGTVSGGTLLGGTDIVVFKMDTNGTIVWIKQQAVMSTTSDDINSDICVDSNGNLYITYTTTGSVSGGTFLSGNDIVVFKMDTNGTIVWIKQHAAMSTQSDDAYPSIVADSSGNTYLTYYTNGTVSSGYRLGSNDVIVLKLDINGDIVWIKQDPRINSTGGESFPDITIDTYGNIYISYHSSGTVSGGTKSGTFDIVVAKLDINGTVQWVKQYAQMNTPNTQYYASIATDSMGGVYVSYNTNGTVSGGRSMGSFDNVIVKLDTNGNIMWVTQDAVMNTLTVDTSSKIAINPNGAINIVYQTSGTVSGGTYLGGDIVVAKLSQHGIRNRIVCNSNIRLVGNGMVKLISS